MHKRSEAKTGCMIFSTAIPVVAISNSQWATVLVNGLHTMCLR